MLQEQLSIMFDRLMVAKENDRSTIEDYKKLDEKCDQVLEKNKKRKQKKTK